MDGRRHAWSVLAIVAVMLIVGRVSSASAADPERSFFAIACDVDPGIVRSDAAPFPPAGCVGAATVQLALSTPEGNSLNACVTGSDGWCSMRAELGRVLVLSVEPFSYPAGYQPQANPLTIRVAEAGQGIVFVRPAPLAGDAIAARLTVHARFCPEGYAGDNWYEHCHADSPGYRQAVTVVGPSVRGAWTDETGDAAFDALPVGTWTIAPAWPERTLRTYAFCSRTGEPGVAFPIHHDAAAPNPATAFVRLTLELGDDVLCDLYAVPGAPPAATSQISFHMRICDDIVPPDQIFAACHGNGLGGGWIDVYDVRNGGFVYQGHLDGGGNVTVLVPPGRYAGQTVPGHYVRAQYVFCSQDGPPETGIEGFPTVGEGEAWTCDVYVATETFR